MNDIVARLVTYLMGMWRYRWHGLLVAWLVCLAGWTWLYLQPDQYRATAKVYVDTASMLRPLLKGLAVETDVKQKINVVVRAMLSRPNLQRVIHKTDLHLRLGGSETEDRMIDDLRRDIHITVGHKRNLYSISYHDPDPKMAKRVVATLLSGFMESALGANRMDTNIAQRFLDQQIAEYEARLRAAEQRLKEFKQKHVGLMPSEGRDYYNRLQAAMEASQDAELALRAARDRRDELRRQLSGEEPTFGLFTPTTAATTESAVETRIHTLEQKLDELLIKYTDKHPDVIALKQSIADLKRQRQQELMQQRESGALRHLATNPVYQKLKVSLGEAEAEVASLQEKAREYRKRVAKLRSLVDTIPKVEAQLKALNRDYDVIRAQYESLLKRRESAKISEQAEQTSDDVKFKVIDPPYVPAEPDMPKRALFMTAILLVGLASGVGFALFLDQIKPAFHDRRTLSQVTGLPVLGVVSVHETPAYIRRRKLRTAGYFACGLLLLVVYAGGIVLQSVRTHAEHATASIETGVKA